MRRFLYVVAIVLMVAGALFTVASLDHVDQHPDSFIAALATVLLSGLLIMLCEISAQIATVLRTQDSSAASVAAPQRLPQPHA